LRVLITSTSGYGHVFPMVPLAMALRETGHDVLWATGSDAGRLVAAAGIDVAPAGMTNAERIHARDALAARAVGVRPEEIAAYMFPRLFGQVSTPRMLIDLLPVAKAWTPDLVVHEQGELAGPLVAALLGLPCVTHAFGGATPADVLQEAGRLLQPVWADQGLELPPYAGSFGSGYLDICPPSLQVTSLAHVPLVFALRPVSYAAESDERLPAGIDEDAGTPLVYVTLGTVHDAVPVLKIAVDAISALPVRVLATVGPDQDPKVLGPQPANVVVMRYIAQTTVLPRCAALVSHGGSGTVLAALANAVPQVCLPHAADQFRNARGVQRSGAGLALLPDAVSAAAVADAVGTVMTDLAFTMAAGRVRAEIMAMPSPTEIVPTLAALATNGRSRKRPAERFAGPPLP
jgi:UDP:flavonoid glycosyltransferase YjiC (YdhE family)